MLPKPFMAVRRSAGSWMQWLFLILLSPLVAGCRFGLEVLIWFRPSLAQGRRVFPDNIRQLIELATAVEVHYAELSDEPAENGQIGTKMGWRSLGMVRLESDRARYRVIQSVLKANRECLGGLLCLDAEYGLRFESGLGRADLMICFWCQQVWVASSADGVERYYPISRRPLFLLEQLLQAGGVPRPSRPEGLHI
jgi:hypothetical protein